MLTTLVINIYICNKYILYFFVQKIIFQKKAFFPVSAYYINGQWCFNNKPLKTNDHCKDVYNQDFFHGAFSLVKGLFLYKIWSQKKVLENKVSNWQDFISRDFLIKGLFLCEILGLLTETIFHELFCQLPCRLCFEITRTVLSTSSKTSLSNDKHPSINIKKPVFLPFS